MSVDNYGFLWCIDHCLPIASFNVLDENEMNKCLNLISLRRMYYSENISKGAKVNQHLYLLQKIKAN